MPFYGFKCDDCQADFDKNLLIANRDDPQVCAECESTNTRRTISAVGFNLSGDGWPSKNYRVSQQMEKKNIRLRGKTEEQRREAPGLRLVPNVEGERVDSWSDAKKLAKDKGKDTASYDPMIDRDKKLKNKPTLK